MKNLLFFAFITILLSACSTPEMLLTNDLKSDVNTYNVKGMNGFQLNQHIKYGEFNTSKIKRGWIKGYDADFILHFQGAKEKLHFTQKVGDGKEAKVMAVGKFRNVELDLINDFFAIALKDENTFAGTIIPQEDRAAWDFIIYDADGGTFKNTTGGFATNANGDKIEIRGVRKMEDNKAKIFGLMVKGYEFYKDGQPIGAVSLIQNGKVWMKKGLDANTELVLSSMMTAVMVRNNLE